MSANLNCYCFKSAGAQRNVLFFFFAAAMACLSCERENEDGKNNIRDYYFPLKKLEEGMVYAYEGVRTDGVRDTTYWFYRSERSDAGTKLIGTYYGQLPYKQQSVEEEVVSNGMLTNKVALYISDNMGNRQPLPVKILSGSAFPFEVSDSGGVFLYKIQFAFPLKPNDSTTLIKNRRYLGDTTITFQDDSYRAVNIELKEMVESGNDQEGYVEPRYPGKEIYAKGIGLVYTEKKISEDYTMATRLIFRCSLEEMEAIFKKKYPDIVLEKPD